MNYSRDLHKSINKVATGLVSYLVIMIAMIFVRGWNAFDFIFTFLVGAIFYFFQYTKMDKKILGYISAGVFLLALFLVRGIFSLIVSLLLIGYSIELLLLINSEKERIIKENESILPTKEEITNDSIKNTKEIKEDNNGI